MHGEPVGINSRLKKPYRNAPNGPKPISHLPKATIAEYINGQANNKIAIKNVQ